MKLAFVSKKELALISSFLVFLCIIPYLSLLIEQIDKVNILVVPDSILQIVYSIGIHQPSNIQLATALSLPIIAISFVFLLFVLISKILKKILLKMIALGIKLLMIFLSKL